LSDLKNRFKSRKILIRRDWNPSIKNAEKKVLIGSKVVFHKGAKRSKYRFFFAAAPQNSSRKKFLYVIGFKVFENNSYRTN
jgi:hypothetical protein